MVVLLIGMAITAVWMSALLPAWRQQVTRQREQDLIFRGEQYARAVALYVMKNRCALPTNVDDLVAQKYLRKKWKDPITNDDFILVPGAQPGQGGAQQPGAATPGGRGGPGGAPPVGQPGRTGAAPVGGVGGGTTGSTAPGGRSGQPTTGLPSGAFPGQSSQSNQSITPGSGIAGVVSKSSGTSIMIYLGQQTYSGWQFMYTQRASKDGSAAAVRSGPAWRPSGDTTRPAGWSRRAAADLAVPRVPAALATDAAEAASYRRHRRLAGSDGDAAAGASHPELRWGRVLIGESQTRPPSNVRSTI